MSTIQEHVNNLKVHGVTVIENVIAKEQVDNYRNLISEYFANGKNRCLEYDNQTIKADGVNQPHFKSFLDIFDNKTLMDVINGVTDNSPRWAYHSDIHLNFQGAKGYHSDAQMHYIDAHKYAYPFNHDNYYVYRMATYLQDHTENEGALYVKPGTHLDPSKTDEYYIGTSAGDIVLFDTRIRHKGGNYAGDRYVMFGPTVGMDNEFTKLHAQGAIIRQLKQNRESEYVLNDFVKDKLDILGIKYD